MQVWQFTLHNINFFGVRHEGKVYIPIAPICEAIGIDWEGQRQRINRDPVLKKSACILKVDSIGSGHNVLCLGIHRIHLWLVGISANSVRAEIRDNVIVFQEEAGDALLVYFMPEYAAMIGVHLPTLKARLLQEDLIDRMTAPVEIPAAVIEALPEPMLEPEPDDGSPEVLGLLLGLRAAVDKVLVALGNIRRRQQRQYFELKREIEMPATEESAINRDLAECNAVLAEEVRDRGQRITDLEGQLADQANAHSREMTDRDRHVARLERRIAELEQLAAEFRPRREDYDPPDDDRPSGSRSWFPDNYGLPRL